MFRYANYQICIFMNINENIRNKRKIVKIKGVYMQIYPHLSCLLSYTTSLLNGPVCKLSNNCFYEY